MSSFVTFCLRCGSALSEGSALCMVCGSPAAAPAYPAAVPVESASVGAHGQAVPPTAGAFGPAPSVSPGQASPPAYAPAYPPHSGVPVPPHWYGAPYPAQPYPPRSASRGHRSLAILAIALGSIGLVVALVGGMFVMMSGSGSGVSVTPESFSCASGNSRSIEFALPDLPQSTKLTITITNEQGSGVSSYTASISDLSQYLQADGRYRIQDSGDSGAECGAGAGTFTYVIWNDDTKEKLLSGTFTVLP